MDIKTEVDKTVEPITVNESRIAFDEAYRELQEADYWEGALLAPAGREELFRLMFHKGAIYGMTRAATVASQIVSQVLGSGSQEVTDDHSG